LDYPNNYDIPSFPAGKTVAFSRSISIWISIVFFLIVAACGFILLGIHLKTNYPFLISIDPFTDEWTVVAYPKERKTEVQQYQVIQEKLARDFATNWFTIDSQQTNELRWKSCSVEECAAAEQFRPDNIKCAISCKSSSTLFEDFSSKVVPWYNGLINQSSEKWTVERMLFTQNVVSEKSSRWQVIADIKSNVRGTFKVLSFMEINRNVDLYPSTLGYYVQEFNAFRINNE
jgi:hypothetical protein